MTLDEALDVSLVQAADALSDAEMIEDDAPQKYRAALIAALRANGFAVVRVEANDALVEEVAQAMAKVFKWEWLKINDAAKGIARSLARAAMRVTVEECQGDG